MKKLSRKEASAGATRSRESPEPSRAHRARPALPGQRVPGGSGTGLCPLRPPVLGSPACAGRRCGPGRRRAARLGASPRCAGARGAGGPPRRRGPGTSPAPAAAPARPPCPGAAPARPPRPRPRAAARRSRPSRLRGTRLREARTGPMPSPGPGAGRYLSPALRGQTGHRCCLCAETAGKCISFPPFPAWRRDLWRFRSGEGKQRCQLARLADLSLFQLPESIC